MPINRLNGLSVLKALSHICVTEEINNNLVYLFWNYSSVSQSSIENSTIINNTLSASLAIDGDNSTFTQTKIAINNYWRIDFTSSINISCFTIISSGGNFQIAVGLMSIKNSTKICQKFLEIKTQEEKAVRCCQKPLQGDTFEITRTDFGILRLYEVILRILKASPPPNVTHDGFRLRSTRPVQDEKHGLSCIRCRHCATCDANSGMCLSCPPSKYGDDCGLRCPNNCSRCDIKNGTCKACSRCAGDCNTKNETCSQCYPGFVRPPVCYACNNFIRHCVRCSSSENCDQCEEGYHGSQCRKRKEMFVTFTSNLTYTNMPIETTITTQDSEETSLDKYGISENTLHEGISEDLARYSLGMKIKSLRQSSMDYMGNDSYSENLANLALDKNATTFTQTNEAINNFWRIDFEDPVNITCFTIICGQGNFRIKITSSDTSVEHTCDEFSVNKEKESVSRCCRNYIEGTSFVVYRSDNGKLRLYEVSLSDSVGMKIKSLRQSSVDYIENDSYSQNLENLAVDKNATTFTQTNEAINNFWRVDFEDPINFTCFTIISGQGKFIIKITSSNTSLEHTCDEFSVNREKESVSRCCQSYIEGTSFVVYRSDNGKLRLYEVSLIDCFAVYSFCKKCECVRCSTQVSIGGICSSYFPSKCKQGCDIGCLKNCSKYNAEKGFEISKTAERGKIGNTFDSTRNDDAQSKNPNGSMKNDGSPKTDLTGVIFGVVVLCLLVFFFVIKRSDSSENRNCIKYIHPEAIEENEEQTEVVPMSQNTFNDGANSIVLEEITYVNVSVENQRDAEYSNTTSHRLLVDTFIDNHRIRRENNKFEEDEFANLPTGLLDLCTEALKTENICKNRYRYVYPYDFCRVVLNTCDTPGRNDYINACYIEDSQGKHSYIAAQGPFTSLTLIDFWRMVWQENSSRIVMLTNLMEGDKMKCLKYWPEDVIELGNIRIRLECEDNNENYTIRYMIVEQNNETRKICQFHFTGWPDCEVPSNVDDLLCFRNLVKNGRPDSDGPIIVHCRYKQGPHEMPIKGTRSLGGVRLH
ncbi:uncharacterized protein LOC134238859 [Saccostrea cucullata]|uniref:uncharacterized protein LOC134238859 n=1 Tax=Saccostrea cuccullata TaxID=36930 RepID=UPI002ED050A4